MIGSNLYIGLFSRKTSGLPTAPITTIPYTQFNGMVEDIQKVARVGTEYTATIGVSNSYAITWQIIDSLTRDVVTTGFGNEVTYTFSSEHFKRAYDIYITVYWSGGGLGLYIRRGIRRVWDELYVSGGAGITTVDITSASGFWTTPPATNKVFLTGNRASGNFIINNWPNVSIQIDPNSNVINNTTFEIGWGCSGISIDGCTSNTKQFGLTCTRPLGTGDCLVITPGRAGGTPLTENVVIGGIFARYGTTGFHLLPPQTQTTGTFPVTQLAGPEIFNCKAEENDTEGFYIGYTRDYEGFAEMLNPVFHHIEALNTGWDGMQPGNATGIEIHDLIINNAGLQLNSNQWSGFSINGVGDATFHRITMNNCIKGFTGSTGLNHGNVQIFNCSITSTINEALQNSWYRVENTSITPVLMAIYNNIFDTFKEPFGPYCHFCGGAQMNWRYEDNVELGTANPTYTGSHLINQPYTRHWLSAYDKDGYINL